MSLRPRLAGAAMLALACAGAGLALAPASLLAPRLEAASAGRLSLGDPRGSLWHGAATLVQRDPRRPLATPIAPLRWHWQPAALLRGALSWQLQIQGRPAYLSLRPGGWQTQDLSLVLPAETLTPLLPGALAGGGWRGELSLAVSDWRCDYAGHCRGEARIDWQDAASSLLPGRILGDYRIALQADAPQGWLARWRTLAGAITVDADARIAPDHWQIDGFIAGEPALLGRLPNIAGQWVSATGEPGRMRIRFSQPRG